MSNTDDPKIPDNELPRKDLIDTVKNAQGLPGQIFDKHCWELAENEFGFVLGVVASNRERWMFPLNHIIRMVMYPQIIVEDNGSRAYTTKINTRDKTWVEVVTPEPIPEHILTRLGFSKDWVG